MLGFAWLIVNSFCPDEILSYLEVSSDSTKLVIARQPDLTITEPTRISAGTGRSEVPPSLENLANVNGLVINKTELLDTFNRIETKNRYSLCDPTGKQVFLSYEESSFIDSSCCGKSREFTVVVTNNLKEPTLTIQRRVEGWSGCSLFGWKGVCGKDECVIENQKEILVGRILQSQSCCCLKYLVHDMFGEVVFRIEGPFYCGDVEYKIFTVSDNAQIGAITQKDTTFMVNFPLNLDINLKSVLLGATFLIGFTIDDRKL